MARCRKQKKLAKKIGKAIFCQLGPNSHCQKLCNPCRAAVNNAPRFWLSLKKEKKEKVGSIKTELGKENYQEGDISSKTEREMARRSRKLLV